MRPSLAVCVVAACAAPALAGPIPFEYRTTLGTNLPSGPGPTHRPGETAYPLSPVQIIGVVAGGVPAWTPATPAYPTARFSVVPLGGFTPFTDRLFTHTYPPAEGGGRFAVDVDLRNPDGRAGRVTFAGTFRSAWGDDQAFFVPSLDGPDAKPVVVGGTRYDVRLGYGWMPDFQQREDGRWEEVRYAVDPVPYWDGAYRVEAVGGFYATITPTAATPEPGTLLMAGVGLGGLLVGRRWRRRSRPVGDAARGITPL